MIKDQIKKARIWAGYTQSEAAKALGVTRQAYGIYETGKQTPRMPKLREIAALFKVDVSFFSTDNDLDITAVGTSDSDIAQSIVSTITGMSDADKKKVTEYAELLVKARTEGVKLC